MRFFQLQVILQLGTIHPNRWICFVIRANSELQLRYDNVILLSHKLMLSRLSSKHSLVEMIFESHS
jgi:hypothetical protein